MEFTAAGATDHARLLAKAGKQENKLLYKRRYSC